MNKGSWQKTVAKPAKNLDKTRDQQSSQFLKDNKHKNKEEHLQVIILVAIELL